MISVIVPVYNCEEKLNRCVESILNQSISELDNKLMQSHEDVHIQNY